MDQIFGRWAWPAGIRAVRRTSPRSTSVRRRTSGRVLFAGGLDPKTLDISMQQNLLAVSGSRKLELDEAADYYRRERFDGDFRRVITLPRRRPGAGRCEVSRRCAPDYRPASRGGTAAADHSELNNDGGHCHECSKTGSRKARVDRRPGRQGT